ncbi:homoserine kinase [Desulfosporosinus nitroreducens]|uniref:Homoserine kinase n=1 Tax=Desulfosporosinus nitroreducens TaxID=2018668 RepID=A0ABT8QXZ8_9FIRM|nr:homoserine kinase [Desulfosporosinus nitroreducens]MCO1603544.1 homoserine kinase [Desulfosporosinus nitroreducens]MDO0825449.1 homoserine kinase [Desulfosporosinus nitroreducens]
MFRIKIPATSANLGPGFDCLGMALQLYNTITVETKRPFRISLTGSYKEGIPADESNLVWRTMCHFWDLIHYPVPTVDLTFENCIPPARGLGSSSAAIVGGLATANAIAGSPYTKLELLQVANALEGHPDNVTPALYGGVTLSVPTEKGVLPRVLAQSPNLKAVVIIPDTPLNTKKARGILPPQVHRKDAVFNISHVSLLTEAFIREEYSLLKEAMCDKLHQSQRAALIPGLLETLEAALQAGAYGAALSGSGPTLLALIPRSFTEDVSLSMTNMLEKHGNIAQAMVLEIDANGASSI